MSENNFYSLGNRDKIEIFEQVSKQTNLPAVAVEKDWWVVKTLAIIFSMDVASHIVFKGGTSLSKVWKIIDRFSEDIDLALDRKYLGFDGELSKTKVRKLRKESFKYISEIFFQELKERFANKDMADVEIKLGEIKDSDQDPIIIEIYYPSVFETGGYLKPRVIVELGSRSLKEPFTLCKFSSLLGEIYPKKVFADDPIEIATVNAERTFLEKVFLLHEEFQKDPKKIRVNRLSRHLYDIDKLMKSKFGNLAIEDENLYREIVKHRSTITAVRGIDYKLHQPKTINLIPPDGIIDQWGKDYKRMQEEMIYGESLPFDKLIESIKELNKRINQLDWAN